jgi:hypothetical protein
VRSKTESPCPRRAAVEILGVAFCEACAREQRAYFAIGELTQEEKAQGFRSKPLAGVLERMLVSAQGVRKTWPQRCITGTRAYPRASLSLL